MDEVNGVRVKLRGLLNRSPKEVITLCTRGQWKIFGVIEYVDEQTVALLSFGEGPLCRHTVVLDDIVCITETVRSEQEGAQKHV